MLINIGSGQRGFNVPWTNIDIISRPPNQVPNICADARNLPFAAGSASIVVLHHVLEHFGCGEADGIIRESHRVLKHGGSLLVFVPNLRALATRWLIGELDDWHFTINIYGAYQGLEGDRHRWGYTQTNLCSYLRGCCSWGRVVDFDWRFLEGADIARDWWIAAVEAVK